MSSQQTIDNFQPLPEGIIRFNNWVFENVQSYLRGRALELNSGEAMLSSVLIEQGIPIHLSDKHDETRYALRKRYYDSPFVKKVHNIDIVKENFASVYASLFGKFSTVLSLIITEPKPPIELVLANAKLLLRKGGILITSVPSHTELFPGATQEFKEIRNNNRKLVTELLSDFRILKTRYYNFERDFNLPKHGPAGLSLIAVVQTT